MGKGGVEGVDEEGVETGEAKGWEEGGLMETEEREYGWRRSEVRRGRVVSGG